MRREVMGDCAPCSRLSSLSVSVSRSRGLRDRVLVTLVLPLAAELFDRRDGFTPDSVEDDAEPAVAGRALMLELRACGIEALR